MKNNYEFCELISGFPFAYRALQSVPRRHTAFYHNTEFRVHELNKRLQQRTEVRTAHSIHLAYAVGISKTKENRLLLNFN